MKFQSESHPGSFRACCLVAVVSAGLEVVVAQPKGEPSRPGLDSGQPSFESLGENKLVNINNIAYTSDGDELFDIYFACSSTRGEDPLRLTDPERFDKRADPFFTTRNDTPNIFSS